MNTKEIRLAVRHANTLAALDGMRIQWIPETEEFRVSYMHIKNAEASAYYTTDLNDAIATQKIMAGTS